MKQFTAVLCLALLSLSSARSIPRPMLVAPDDCNATEFQAGLVLEEINKDREDGYIFSLFRVVDAHSQQVSAGKIYYFTMDVLETSCPVISGKSSKDCEVRSFHQAVFGQCKAIMYNSLTQRRVKLYNYTCTLSSVPPQMIHRMCPDCPTPARDLTPFVEKAERMVVEFNKQHSQPHYFKLLKVERASSAWMMGPSSFVEFSIKETNCPSSTANPADCHFLEKDKAHVGFCKGSQIAQQVPGQVGDKVTVACDMYDPKPSKPEKKKACDHGEMLQHCHVKAEGTTRTCKVEAYQKPGETTFSIESLNCNLPAAGAPEVLLPIMCPGCPEHVSGNSDEVQTILKQAIEKYNKENNQAEVFKVGEILKATSQVVAGFKYTIEFKIQETDCSKSDAEHHTHDCKNEKPSKPEKKACDHGDTLQHCHVKAEGTTRTCKVEAYQKPGETTFSIESVNCNLPAAGAPEVLLPIMCPGCPEHVSGNSDEVQTILKQAIEKYNKENNQAEVFKVGEILKATSQVVAGFKYTIEFKIQETNCSKSDAEHHTHDCKHGKDDEHHGKEPCAKADDSHTCHTKTGGETHTCKVEYWIQSWTNTRKIVSLNCDLPAGGSPAANRPTKCAGCPSPIPGNSEKLQPILHEALEKYNRESNQAHVYKLGQIIKAESQVVSGYKYIIEFTIEETNCTAADLPTKSADCKADGHHGHHEHGHGHSHEHGHGHHKGHGHGHGHDHGHHHHHQKGHHGSSEEQTGSKTAQAAEGPVGSVHHVDLADAADVLPAASIPSSTHPVVVPAIFPEQTGPLPFYPFTDPEPLPFPTTPSVSPSCPGEPKHSFPLILPLLPVPK